LYLGSQELFSMAGAFAAMGQLPMDFELPEGVPPVAAGIGFQGGGAETTVFIPSQVIEFAGQMAMMAAPPPDDF